MSILSFRKLVAGIGRRVFLPLIPQSKKLPFLYWLRLIEDSCENELRYLHHIGQEHKVAIDVGANIGLFSYNMSKRFSKVYSFEINDGLTKDLSAYNPGNIEIINKGLSSKAERLILYIPLVDGSPLPGWASLTPDNCPATKEHLEKQVDVSPLDSFDIQSVSLIKIDVEGHEVEVLKGATQTLACNRPIVLIEIKPCNRDEVISLFTKIEYQQRSLQDLVGITGSEENYIFVPHEKL